MNRINKIIKNKRYLEYVQRIKIHEKDRIFCKHDMVHFLDVCRLAEIEWLELKVQVLEEKQQAEKERLLLVNDAEFEGINKEMIYAASLLHDVGRWQEYENGIRHETASSKLAYDILRETGFSDNETEEIVLAISNHRNSNIKEEISLSGFLYRADKKSRACFCCEAEPQCSWSVLKKNLELK